jgi:hypothetical protein
MKEHIKSASTSPTDPHLGLNGKRTRRTCKMMPHRRETTPIPPIQTATDSAMRRDETNSECSPPE